MEGDVSHFDYEASKAIALKDYPFYALIMAAMRQADTDSTEKLQVAFPDTWKELQVRYHTAGGLLPEENTFIDARGETCEGSPHFQCERCGESFDARREERTLVDGWELCPECYQRYLKGYRHDTP